VLFLRDLDVKEADLFLYRDFDEVLRRVKAVPGVQSAGITDALPLGRNRTWGAPAKGVKQDSDGAARLTKEGKDLFAAADKATNPKEAGTDLENGVRKYRDALSKDPYNIEATLQLAVAYDRVLRKGCALQMLHRLFLLAENPKWKDLGERAIDAAASNPEWFKGYHTEALKELGK